SSISTLFPYTTVFRSGVLGGQGLLGVLDGVLGLGLVRLGDLVLVVLQQLLALVDKLLEGVASVGVLAALLVLGGVGLGVLDHLRSEEHTSELQSRFDL